jgi:hypothetical protein
METKLTPMPADLLEAFLNSPQTSVRCKISYRFAKGNCTQKKFLSA